MKFRLRIPGISFDEDPPAPSPQARVLAATNAYRASLGLPALIRDATLEQVAQRRAELALQDYEASGVLRHDNPSIAGDRYFELLPVYGISAWNFAGENLWLGNPPDPVSYAVEGWKNSPTHDANLREAWDKIGIGYVFRSPTGFSCLSQVFLDVSGGN